KTTCSPASATSGMPAKMTTTISSSVSSSEPGTEVASALRPLTSTSVSTMMANSATAASTPQKTRRVCLTGRATWAAGSLLELLDLGAVVGEQLARVLHALGRGRLDPGVDHRRGLLAHRLDERRVGLRELHAVGLHEREPAAVDVVPVAAEHLRRV